METKRFDQSRQSKNADLIRGWLSIPENLQSAINAAKKEAIEVKLWESFLSKEVKIQYFNASVMEYAIKNTPGVIRV